MSEEILGALKVLVLDDEGQRAKAMAALVEGAPGLELAISAVGADDGLSASRKHHPGVVVLVAGASVPLETIEKLSAAMPDVPVVVLLDAIRRDAETDCLLAGARLCLTELGSREELIGTMRRLHSQERRRAMKLAAAAVQPYESKLGQVIAVHSAKGGGGTTMLATNLAVVLKRATKKNVALVDANLQSGDVAVLLDIFSGNNIADLLPHLRELDEDLLNEVMVEHSSGVKVLLAPPLLEQADAVKGDQVQRILTALRQVFAYIVVDTAPILDPVTIAALDTADTVLALSTPDMQALRNTARFLRLSEQFGYPKEKVKLVINKGNAAEAIGLMEIQQTLQHKAVISIHHDGREITRAANRGEPLVLSASRNKVSKDIRNLASILTGTRITADVEKTAGEEQKPKVAEADSSGKRPRLLPF